MAKQSTQEQTRINNANPMSGVANSSAGGVPQPPQANEAQKKADNKPPEPPKPMTLAEFKALVAKASTIEEIVAANKTFKASQDSIKEQEAKRAKAESDALAGVRLAYEVKLTERLNTPETISKLNSLKANGFTASLVNDGRSIEVHLAVPTIRIVKRGGGGSHGKTQTTAGGLDASFKAVATAEELAEYNTKEGNSAQWVYKNKVVKAALANGKLTPKA